jgi:hypothetical protein
MQVLATSSRVATVCASARVAQRKGQSVLALPTQFGVASPALSAPAAPISVRAGRRMVATQAAVNGNGLPIDLRGELSSSFAFVCIAAGIRIDG